MTLMAQSEREAGSSTVELGGRRYILDRPSGGGHQVRSYEGRCERTGRLVHVHIGVPTSEIFVEEWTRSVSSMAWLGQPNGNLLGFGEAWLGGGRRVYRVETRCGGRTLAQIIADEGVLGAERTANIARMLLAGLAQAHGQGVLHRNIGPRSVVLFKSTSDEEARLIHFRPGPFPVWDGGGGVVPPEVVIGGAYEISGDVFGVGALMLACLRGRACAGKEIRAALAEVDGPLAHIIERALSSSPKARFASAAAFAEALAAPVSTNETRQLRPTALPLAV